MVGTIFNRLKSKCYQGVVKVGFNIGAEYVVNDDWALGLDYHTTSDDNVTRLFAKVFY